jgi:hypothetical protein
MLWAGHGGVGPSAHDAVPECSWGTLSADRHVQGATAVRPLRAQHRPKNKHVYAGEVPNDVVQSPGKVTHNRTPEWHGDGEGESH